MRAKKALRAISLMYHDIVERGAEDASGFPGRDAALYKLERAGFVRHLRAVGAAAGGEVSTVFDLAADDANGSRRAPVLITFDDGGASAHAVAAPLLEEFGWRGHFFVTAGRVGTPGFLSRRQVAELHERGHVVGSHSHTHPTRMARCTWDEMCDEWSRSVELLTEITGTRVRAASVPGGFYSERVARAAERAGVEFLFTSEPTARARRVGRCAVLGRYAVQSWTRAETAGAIARGAAAPRARQLLLWNAKKVGKTLGGTLYLKTRRALIGAGGEEGRD